MDDPFVSCPYNKFHRVPRSRIQGHIVKCQKNYPELVICPYNATHRFPETEMKEHLKNCVAKARLYLDKEMDDMKIRVPPVLQTDEPQLDPNHEFWDD